ncbi:MAG: arginine--tRNA ligase [Nitrosarchaeum sp.]
MDNISHQLSQDVINSFLKLSYSKYLDINKVKKIFNVPYYGEHGVDYHFNRIIPITKMLKTHVSLEQLANDIIANLGGKDVCYTAEFSHNNIDFKLLPNFVNQNLFKLVKIGHLVNKVDNPKKILVDFSSPNIAKDMHVGHLRSTIIGDAICRFFEVLGHNVHRINHIGDFGLQFGMLIQNLFDKYGENICKETVDLTISDLQKFYAESKKRFDNEEDFKKISYIHVVKLQKGDPTVVKAWEFIKDISRQAYSNIYKRLNIHLKEVGESFYQPMIPDLVEELRMLGLIEEEDGRAIIRVPNHKWPLTVVKSDGGYTYDTTDLAAMRYRLVELGADEVYYVVDQGQSLHFKLIFEVAKLAGWLKPGQKVQHIDFGLVLGDDGKRLRSRNGDTVKLVDLLDEGLSKANEVLESKSHDHLDLNYRDTVVKNNAYGSVKYYDLSNTRTKDYKFSFDQMLSLKGNTAVYLLYAYVRICSIIRNSNQFLLDIQEMSKLKLSHPEEIKLGIYLLRYPEIVQMIGDTLHFHHMCSYMYELATRFTNFFLHCRVLEHNEDDSIKSCNLNRLALCIQVKKVMGFMFHILNIETLEKM